MDIEGTEFTDNVLERFGSGQKFSGENLEKLLYVVEKKLTSISYRIEEIEVELEIEFKNLKTFSHNNHCECDPLAMQCFLNNVVQAAERYVGFEDHIVEILVDFCYHNCIVLPSSSMITGLSHHSINSFENDFSTDQTLLWSKLLIKMRNGLITMLGSLPMTNAENVSKEASPVEFVNYLNSRRFYLFQLLNALYSFDEAVSIYCKIRENQLLVNNGADDRDNPTKEIFKLENTMEIHCIMLSEDFKLFQSIFKDEMDLSPFNKLIAVYSQDICSKLREFTLFYHHDYFMKGSRVSTFTIKDLKLFANAISILHKWHDQVYGITIQLNIRKPQSTEFLFDVYESIREPWEWEKELIQFYPALSASVVSYLKCLPNAIFQDQKFSATIYISDEVLLMNPTYPKKVSYKCGQFLSLIFEMLVFKKMKEISEVVNATITEVLHEYYIYLKQVLNDFLANQRSIESLYMILCDCVLLESLLVQWEEKDLKKKHGIHYLLIQKFKSMKNDMINTISTYHLSTLRLALVYDCHANNWDEEQKFFEVKCLLVNLLYEFFTVMISDFFFNNGIEFSVKYFTQYLLCKDF